MKKFKTLLVTGVLVGGTLASNVAYARTIGNYDTIVGKLNGSGYTGHITKATSNEPAVCNSSSNGGGYKVDVRIQRSTGTQSSSWKRLSSGSRVSIPNTIGSGLTTRLHFSNDLTTAVNVQVRGSWSPDTN